MQSTAQEYSKLECGGVLLFGSWDIRYDLGSIGQYRTILDIDVVMRV